LITAIEIENFKAFGQRQRIELRPLTLLFGPNSGGKSSLVHALHYLREVLCEGNIDAHRTRSGGDSLDLGGIQNFVHDHNPRKAITFRVEMEMSGLAFDSFGSDVGTFEDEIERTCGSINSFSVEVQLVMRPTPWLEQCRVAFNGEHFADLYLPATRPQAEIRQLNWLHPVLLDPAMDAERWAALDKNRRQQIESFPVFQEAEHAALGSPWTKYYSLSRPDEEDFGLLARMFTAAGISPLNDPDIFVPLPVGPVPSKNYSLVLPNTSDERLTEIRHLEALLSRLILGPLLRVTEALKDLRYVGPLRAVPGREAIPPAIAELGAWANGRAAWTTLAVGRTLLNERVDSWLSHADKLDTGYGLEQEDFRELRDDFVARVARAQHNIDTELGPIVNALAEQLRDQPAQSRVVLKELEKNLRLKPRDVGVGLSQVIPVLVAVLERDAGVVCLEQPELHLHPRQQAALGDLLIEGVKLHPTRQFIVETHSEHLILRILRRIRETTRGQATKDHTLSPQDLKIQYIRRSSSGSRAQSIDVDVNGDLVDEWPDDFFDQDFKERFA
jgi:predicted ATPase